MAALKVKSERVLLDEIEQLKSTTIDLQAKVIELLRQSNLGNNYGDRSHGSAQYRQLDFSSSQSNTTEFLFDSRRIRALDRDGEIWFVAGDVCQALEIINHRDAVGKLDQDEKDGVGLSDAIGRLQQTTIINESGLYTLILRCRDATKPGSKTHKFRKWVTSEVLPTIRKTGHYEVHRQESYPNTSISVDDPLQDCGIHDAEFLAFLAVTKGRMGGSRKMDELLSIHTAKVLRWIWYRCPDERLWYTASRLQIAQDLGMHHTTALRCAKRLEEWRFIEQRIIARVTECKLFRSVVESALARAGAFQLPAASQGGNLRLVLPSPNSISKIDLSRLAKVAGSPAAALFLAKAIECHNRTGVKNGGWWLKTRAEWTAQTGLSRCEQETARRLLRRVGVLMEKKRGLPASMWYRIDEAVLVQLLNQRKVMAIEGPTVWH